MNRDDPEVATHLEAKTEVSDTEHRRNVHRIAHAVAKHIHEAKDGEAGMNLIERRALADAYYDLASSRKTQ